MVLHVIQQRNALPGLVVAAKCASNKRELIEAVISSWHHIISPAVTPTG